MGLIMGNEIGTGRPQRRSLKLLMIGNSFSISVLRQMPSVAKAMGLDLDISSMCIGGCSFERHWNNLCSTDPGFKPYGYERNVRGETLFMDVPANLREVLGGDTWDVVTLQQASHLSWCPETYRPFADDIVAELRKLQPQAEIVIQETWSYTPWDARLAKWGITADEMYAKLHRAYWDYAGANGFRVIPTGAAVQLYRRRLPVVYTENSFGGDPCGGRWGGEFVRDENGKWVKGPGLDVFHLGYDGEYLQALVWTGTLFGVDVSKCPYVPDYVVDPVRADRMRECAEAACRAAAAGTEL